MGKKRAANIIGRMVREAAKAALTRETKKAVKAQALAAAESEKAAAATKAAALYRQRLLSLTANTAAQQKAREMKAKHRVAQATRSLVHALPIIKQVVTNKI